MAKFIVGVEVTIGEQEKHTVHLIEAETRSHAMLQALADESHGYGRVDSDGIWWDLGGEMAYAVDHCSTISDDDAKVMTKTGLFFTSHFDPEQIAELISDDEEKDIGILLSYF